MSKLLADTLAQQVDAEGLTAEDIGEESDARPFVSGVPRRAPTELETLTRMMANMVDLRLALAIQRGILRSDVRDDRVTYSTPQASGLEREFTNGEHAAKVIPKIRSDLVTVERDIYALVDKMQRAGHRFGYSLGLGNLPPTAPIDGNMQDE